MGAYQAKERTKKGVTYSKDTHAVVDCLFCRIARGESAENELWYSDDKCSVFVPRTPVARLHLLVVPIAHIQNISTLTEQHRPLLEHMKKVAMEQLTVHSRHIGSGGYSLLSLAKPPSHYAFNRGLLPSLCSSSEVEETNTSSSDPSFVLCFHRPPYNSIDHLHLHAIQEPYRNVWHHFMFVERFPWHASLNEVFLNLHAPNAKL